MKILFTGGGSGGHFYPIIAVAEEIKRISEEEHLLAPQLYLMAPDPYDKAALQENGITFIAITAGKMRRYFSLFNITDGIKTAVGVLYALIRVYALFPDVVFAKGGYASFPVLFAARLFGIPVVIHESDSVPGRTNLWAGKFARRIAVAYAQSAERFPKEKTAYVGSPIRREMTAPQKTAGRAFLQLGEDLPVLLVLGGSLGSQTINDAILDILPQLTEKYEVIHQVGKKNFKEVERTSKVVMVGSKHPERYHIFPYLNILGMKMAAGVADLVISRAGSTIFEIAQWGIPSVIIPITNSNGDHQRQNAYAYARTGAALVVEEENLTRNVLLSGIDRLIAAGGEREAMIKSAKAFAKPDAAEKIAREIINIGLEHAR